MKKIVDRKIYCTGTAECLAMESNGFTYGDYNFIEESLYVTKKGSYFLHVKGGANTKYAERYGNVSSEGEDIIPLSEDAALDWIEDNNRVDLALRLFKDKVKEA